MCVCVCVFVCVCVCVCVCVKLFRKVNCLIPARFGPWPFPYDKDSTPFIVFRISFNFRRKYNAPFIGSETHWLNGQTFLLLEQNKPWSLARIPNENKQLLGWKAPGSKTNRILSSLRNVPSFPSTERILFRKMIR